MRRVVALGVALGLLAGSCGFISGQQTEEELVLEHLSELERSPHAFTYREEVDGRVLAIRGRVEDDFRRAGTVSIDGTEAIEVVVGDDALAVRALEPDAVPGIGALEDPVAVEALQEGRWVVDHTAAPELFPPTTREGSVAIGLGPFLDTLYLGEYLERAITNGVDMWEHNPDDVRYNPADDPFVELTEELSRDAGYRRFDVIPPPLPGRSQRGTEEAVPSVPHFRKLSFFVRGRQIERIVEEISLERQEFRRARAGREAEYYLDLLESVREGFIREPMRLRRMSYEVHDPGEDVSIALPVDDVETGHLGGLFDPDGLTEVTLAGLELDAEIQPETAGGLPAGIPDAPTDTDEEPMAPDEAPDENPREPSEDEPAE